MLREDKNAQVERQLASKTPIYGERPPENTRLGRIAGVLSSKQVVAGWKETYVYELSSGKRVTPTGKLSNYMFVHLPKKQYEQMVEAQRAAPVLVTTWQGKRWWWYLDRFWWDSEGLEADDVQVLVLQRDRQKQATLDRARTGDEHIANVEGLNAEIAAMTSALENLLAEALERELSVDFDFTNDDRETVASYFSLVLDTSPYPQGFPKTHRVAFVPESRQLVVEYELPLVSIVPPVKA